MTKFKQQPVYVDKGIVLPGLNITSQVSPFIGLLGNTKSTISAGKVFDYQNNGTSLLSLDYTGKLCLAPKSGAASVSGLLMGTGTTASPALSSVADDKFIEIRAKSTATSGDNRLGYLRYDLGGAGGGGECMRLLTDLTAAVGTAHGAHISLQAGATGYVTGSGIGTRSQLYIKNEAVHANGTYYGGQSEIYSEGSTSSLAAATKAAIHSFAATGNATGAATVKNTFAVDGIAAAGITNMITSTPLNELAAVNAVGFAVIVNDARYYIPIVPEADWN